MFTLLLILTCVFSSNGQFGANNVNNYNNNRYEDRNLGFNNNNNNNNNNNEGFITTSYRLSERPNANNEQDRDRLSHYDDRDNRDRAPLSFYDRRRILNGRLVNLGNPNFDRERDDRFGIVSYNSHTPGQNNRYSGEHLGLIRDRETRSRNDNYRDKVEFGNFRGGFSNGGGGGDGRKFYKQYHFYDDYDTVGRPIDFYYREN